MKYLKVGLFAILVAGTASCGQTNQKDNTTNSTDTMVIKKDRTDSATNTISTDTTKR